MEITDRARLRWMISNGILQGEEDGGEWSEKDDFPTEWSDEVMRDTVDFVIRLAGKIVNASKPVDKNMKDIKSTGNHFWMVWNPSMSIPAKRHLVSHEARAESERLAAKHPGERIFVLESVYSAIGTVAVDSERIK